MTKPITDRPLKPAGRKAWEYDEAIATDVCDRLSQGESLRAICEDPAMPSNQTIYRWAAVQPIFRSAYARAREAQMEIFSQEIIEIADDAAKLKTERIGKNGEVTDVVTDPGAVQAAKLRIDTRWRLMSTLARAIYGDKLAVDLSATVEVSALSDEELEARTQARLKALGVEVTGPLLLGLAPAKAAVDQPVDQPEPVDPEPDPGG